MFKIKISGDKTHLIDRVLQPLTWIYMHYNVQAKKIRRHERLSIPLSKDTERQHTAAAVRICQRHW